MKLSLTAFFAFLTIIQTQVSAQSIDSISLDLSLKMSIENTLIHQSNVQGLNTIDIDQLMRYSTTKTLFFNDPQTLPRPKVNNRKWYNSNWFYITAGVVAATGLYMIIDSSGKTDPVPLPYPPALPNN